MKTRIGSTIAWIGLASLVAIGSATGCATGAARDKAPPGDRAVQDFYENECPECGAPGTAPITIEEAQ